MRGIGREIGVEGCADVAYEWSCMLGDGDGPGGGDGDKSLLGQGGESAEVGSEVIEAPAVLGRDFAANAVPVDAAREGAEAVRCLEHSVRMDGAEPKARKLLGEVLYRIGAVRKAQEHLTALRQFDDKDPEVEALLRHVAGYADSGRDVAQLLADVEAQGCLLHPPIVAVLPSAPCITP